MKNFGVTLLISMAILSQQVFANESSDSSEITGNLQQWVVGSRTLTMNGKSYQLMDDAEFLNANLQLMNRGLFKPGARVMLRVSNDKVTHIVFNPTNASQFDQPNR